jgi:hypothetical protein
MREKKNMKKKGNENNWIENAIKSPGSLRKTLHVKKGSKISDAKLKKAEESKNPTTRKRANLAETLKKMRK